MKSCLIFILFLSSHFSFSQSFISFPDSNARWTYETCVIDWTPPVSCGWEYYSNYYLTNDTVINTITYSNIEFQEEGYHGALRDNGNGQVFYFPPDSTMEYLVHDFDVNAGDTIQNVYSLMGSAFIEDRYVLSIDSVLIWNNYHKIVSFDNPPVSWIEGIGCPSGFLARSSDILDATRELICMSYNDTIYYPNENLGNCQLDLKSESFHKKEINISPNPSTLGYVMVELPSIDIYTYQIYNTAGQLESEGIIESSQIKTPKNSGIYVLLIKNNEERYFQKLIVE